jgi:hypothetical protein
MEARHGANVVSYPAALGFATWQKVPCGKQPDEPRCTGLHTLRNDGFGETGAPVLYKGAAKPLLPSSAEAGWKNVWVLTGPGAYGSPPRGFRSVALGSYTNGPLLGSFDDPDPQLSITAIVFDSEETARARYDKGIKTAIKNGDKERAGRHETGWRFRKKANPRSVELRAHCRNIVVFASRQGPRATERRAQYEQDMIRAVDVVFKHAIARGMTACRANP